MDWILCSERLPENDGEYLCVIATSYNGYTISIRYFEDGEFDCDDFVWADVVSWMPLPEIPNYKRFYKAV